jgi:hypothetical protein
VIELAIALQWPPAALAELDATEFATVLDVLDERRQRA